MHFQGWLSEQLLSPKSCSFGVIIASLISRNIYYIWSIKLLYRQIIFSKQHLQPSILYSSESFYLKRGVATGHSLFQLYWLLLEDQLELPIRRVIFLSEQLQPPILSGVIWNREFLTADTYLEQVLFYKVSLTSLCQWYSHQTFKLFDLNDDFPKLT